MREIKFRAFNRFKMIYRGLHDRNWYTESVGGLLVEVAHPNDCRQLKIMQYTGLKDKNGKEIFEGDITNDKYVIMWHIEKALFAEHFYSTFNDVWNIASYPISSQGIEIIGNIHEHPHLLKNNR